jgi:hypothetical protein
MRAEGADREHLVPPPREQHRFAVSVPEQHGAVDELRERDACDEVRPVEVCRCVVHSLFLISR